MRPAPTAYGRVADCGHTRWIVSESETNSWS